MIIDALHVGMMHFVIIFEHHDVAMHFTESVGVAEIFNHASVARSRKVWGAVCVKIHFCRTFIFHRRYLVNPLPLVQ